MIQSYACKRTEALFNNERHKKLPIQLQSSALRKLRLIDAAEQVDDLNLPPGNRLEKLSGDREGQYSIRINQQYRICFRFEGKDAFEVEIVDYH